MVCSEMKDLTNRQKLFVEEYLICWNATQAAVRAGYSPKTARVMGQENLHKPAIAARIEARLKEKTLSADEVLARLSDQATMDMGEFLSVVETKRGKRVTRKLAVDPLKVVDSGKTHLIKKIVITAGRMELELYDGQAALVQLGRYHKLFTDRTIADWQREVTAAGGSPGDIFEKLVQLIALHIGGSPQPVTE